MWRDSVAGKSSTHYSIYKHWRVWNITIDFFLRKYIRGPLRYRKVCCFFFILFFFTFDFYNYFHPLRSAACSKWDINSQLMNVFRHSTKGTNRQFTARELPSRENNKKTTQKMVTYIPMANQWDANTQNCVRRTKDNAYLELRCTIVSSSNTVTVFKHFPFYYCLLNC